jgi:hypothetical protein
MYSFFLETLATRRASQAAKAGTEDGSFVELVFDREEACEQRGILVENFRNDDIVRRVEG